MSVKVLEWLENLGLGQYATAFEENAIDWELLPELDQETLKDIGVSIAGHRLRILKAASALLAEQPSIAPGVEAKNVAENEATSPSEEDPAAWSRTPGERKPVTMLFADVVGSTNLTEKLDAEEAHDLLYRATQIMCEAVENNGGTVCRFMGDGIMAMFGAPIASEQHAVEACEAALEMQQAIRDYAADGGTSELRIRVGLHSGEVVVLTVGEGDNVEYDASGPTVPIAARMEQSAQPGEVYLTTATHSLAAKRIETDSLEPIAVKGISEPVPVFALSRVRSVEEAIPDTARTPFVGRRAELNQFRGMLDTSIEEGHGQTIYVRGEPGIGKTRLVEEFMTIAAEKGASTHRGLVLPFGVGKGQDAIHSLVRSLLGIAAGAGKDGRLLAAETALNDGRLDPGQAVFLNDLLDLPQSIDQKSLYDAMDNNTRNEGMRAVIAALLSHLSKNQPTVVVIEDVHWSDTLTLEHLAELTKTVADCPALLVMTSRIEGDQLDQNWRNATDGSPFVAIDLGPLRNEDSIALIGEFIDASDELAASCIERAAGNPLFLEQLLHNAQEGVTESLPDSIQSLVLARMDRLDVEDKRALQAASVIGQRFTSDVLSHLLKTEEYNCGALVAHSLVRPDGEGYLFAHALIQEGVYGSLLKRQCRELHQKTAEWFADDLVLHAQHLDYAGHDKAPRAYLHAAREQARQYRYETALSLIDSGLNIEPQQLDRHPLTCLKAGLLLDLGEVESSMAVYQQAQEYAGDEGQLCDALMGMAACMRVTTEYTAALELLEKCQPVGVKRNLTRQLSQLHHLRGNLYFPLGNDEGCREEHQRALEYARKAGSVEDEARALGGLGDAEYARGRMRSAYEALRMCVERCREHGFGRIEVANLGQMANSQVYLAAREDVLRDSLEAVRAAVRVSHHRAEMNALTGVCHAAYDLGDVAQFEASTNRGLELARKLKASIWETVWLMRSSEIFYLRGDRDRACEGLEAALKNESTLSFIGAWAFGCLAMTTADPMTRTRALREGEQLLEQGVGAGHLWFYRSAIEACLYAGDWPEVERHAQALEDFTRPEPLPISDFFVAYGRVLSVFGRGNRDDETMQELQRLRDEAVRLGLKVAISPLEKALSSN